MQPGFLFLLIAHIGLASMFVVWRPKFDCPSDNPDEEGTCWLLSMYILVASWITPVLLVAYVVALALMLHKRRVRAHLPQEDYAYPSANSALSSMMPISTVHTPISITFPTRVATMFRHSDSSNSSTPSSSFPSDTSDQAARKGTRLSKLAPYAYWYSNPKYIPCIIYCTVHHIVVKGRRGRGFSGDDSGLKRWSAGRRWLRRRLWNASSITSFVPFY